MNALFELSGPMFDVLRKADTHRCFTAFEIGANGLELKRLAAFGFLLADGGKPPIYSLTEKGAGAVAVLNAPFVPKDGEGAVAQIQRAVAEYYTIPVSEMVSQRRARKVARPRQIAMYLARELTPLSLPAIGRRFGDRDHTTVIHAIRHIGWLDEHDAQISADINHLLSELEGLRS